MLYKRLQDHVLGVGDSIKFELTDDTNEFGDVVKVLGNGYYEVLVVEPDGLKGHCYVHNNRILEITRKADAEPHKRFWLEQQRDQLWVIMEINGKQHAVNATDYFSKNNPHDDWLDYRLKIDR